MEVGSDHEAQPEENADQSNDAGYHCAEEVQVMKEMGLPTEFAGGDRRSATKSKNKKKAARSGRSAAMLAKYHSQKYRLFLKFDEGIALDAESWYSVTPEPIARHIADRCAVLQPAVIVDACCGAGGNTIQFALACPDAQVIAIDISPEKIRLARNNAKVYEVEDKIQFIIGDFMQIATKCRIPADVVFLSPQWGGPGYLKQTCYSIESMTPNGKDMVTVVRQHMTHNIAFLLPRNVNIAELQAVAGECGCVEIERNSIANKTKTLTAYFGDLIPQT